MVWKWLAAGALAAAAVLVAPALGRAGDTVRLGSNKPVPVFADEGAGDTIRLGLNAPAATREDGTNADTLLVRYGGSHGGYGGGYRGGYGRGGYGGGYRGGYGYGGYGRGYYGRGGYGYGGYGRGYYGGYGGYYGGYYNYYPQYYSYPGYYSSYPDFYGDGGYPADFGYGYGGYCPIGLSAGGVSDGSPDYPGAPSAGIETLPAPPPASGDATYPYDGGPRQVVPMPPAEPAPAPTRTPQPRTVPLEGTSVSLPAKAPKYTYAAYGEQLQRSVPADERTTVVIKADAVKKPAR